MSEPFHIGQCYPTLGGGIVEIVATKDDGGPYACVQGDDGIWRYNRPSDRGRVTASAFDMSDLRNLIPDGVKDTP